MKLSEKLRSLNIELPPQSGPFGSYVPVKRSGDLVFVAGTLPMKDGKLMVTGPVPSQCSVDDAKAGARQCVVNALAAVKAVLGDVDQLTGVLRLGVFVNSDDAFTDQPGVANGASDLLLELFGESGRHVRAAVGANTLPRGGSVEIEFVFEARTPGA